MVVKKSGDSTVLEVWAGGRLVKERQVPKELHGAVYNDNWFGTGAAWSKDETRIAYVAEVPPKPQNCGACLPVQRRAGLAGIAVLDQLQR